VFGLVSECTPAKGLFICWQNCEIMCCNQFPIQRSVTPCPAPSYIALLPRFPGGKVRESGGKWCAVKCFEVAAATEPTAIATTALVAPRSYHRMIYRPLFPHFPLFPPFPSSIGGNMFVMNMFTSITKLHYEASIMKRCSDSAS